MFVPLRFMMPRAAMREIIAKRKRRADMAGMTKEMLVWRSRAYWRVSWGLVRLYVSVRTRADFPTLGPQVRPVGDEAQIAGGVLVNGGEYGSKGVAYRCRRI